MKYAGNWVYCNLKNENYLHLHKKSWPQICIDTKYTHHSERFRSLLARFGILVCVQIQEYNQGSMDFTKILMNNQEY